MKIKFLTLFLFILSGLPILAVSAQTQNIKITFGSPQNAPASCTAGIKGDKYEVTVPGNSQPEATNSQNIGIRLQGSDVIFSFKIDTTANATCQIVANGLEIIATEISQLPPAPVITLPKALTTDEKKDAKKEALDLSVPESPGFTILGLNPQTVVRPASPREFATTLINGFDDNGNIQNGVAIDTAPYLLLFRPSLQAYRNEDSRLPLDIRKPRFSLDRVASRIQFSLATVKGSSDADKSARIGAGLHFTVFDFGDPNLDKQFDTCISTTFTNWEIVAASNLKINLDPLQQSGQESDLVSAEINRLKALTREQFKKNCIAESKKRNFARSSLIIGGAGSWISTNGDTSKFRNNGSAIWTSLAYGFEGLSGLEQKSQLIFHFRRRIQEKVPDPLNAGKFINKDSNLFGTRFRFGIPRWTGNIEGVYQGEHYAGRKADSNFKFSFGSDYQLAPNLYLNFSIGGETKNSSISNNKVFVKTSFNWGASQKPLN